MDTTATTGGKSIAESTESLDNDPDHLLILVHGIMARYIFLSFLKWRLLNSMFE